MVNGESDRVFDSSYFDIHLWKLTWNPKIGGLVQMIFLFRPGDDFQVPAVNFPGCSWLIVNLITMCIYFLRWHLSAFASCLRSTYWQLLKGPPVYHMFLWRKRCSYWQFCWWPFWVVENVTLFNGCWWPPTFGDEKVTLNHLEEGMDLGWDILHPERLANVAYHLLCGPCCYWLSSCVWVLWLWASWTQKKRVTKWTSPWNSKAWKGHDMYNPPISLGSFMHENHVLFVFASRNMFVIKPVPASFLDDIWGDICSPSAK